METLLVYPAKSSTEKVEKQMPTVKLDKFTSAQRRELVGPACCIREEGCRTRATSGHVQSQSAGSGLHCCRCCGLAIARKGT